MLRPIFTHFNSLVGARVRHFEVSLLDILLAQLFQLDLVCMFERIMMNLTLRYLTRLCNEISQTHVKIVEAVQIHLCLVELVLEVKRLLDELEFDERGCDLGDSKLL